MPPPTPLRIAHPFTHIRFDERVKLNSSISSELNDYLFKRLLPESGHQAAILAYFLVAFHAECVKRGIGMRPGLPVPVWDEENEAKCAQILADMNFEKPKPKKVKP